MQMRALVIVLGVFVGACGEPLPGAGDGGTGAKDGATSASDSGIPAPGDAGNASTTDGGTNDAGADVVAQPFTLTSTALAEGATFAVDNTCTGTDSSPPFAWTPGPSGTMSYAIVLTDTTNKLVHWAIYDIPLQVQVEQIPAGIERVYEPKTPLGSKQAKSYMAARQGYAGPCPPTEHVYELALYAVDVAKLPNTTIGTTKEQIVTLLATHKLGVAKLTGKYKKP